MEDEILGTLSVDAALEEQEQKTIIKLSASSTKTFEQCPRKYYYTYIEKLPKKDWGHLTLGKFCHKVLELFHVRWKQDKNLELVGLIGNCFADARQDKEFFGIITPAQLEEAKGFIQDYLFGVEKNGMPNTLAVEEPFKLFVDKFMLRGFIDRIDIDPDGLFHILDYKTSKNEKYLDDFQLLVYGMALKNKYPDMDRFRGSYVMLRQGSKLITHEFSVHDIYKCEKKILNYGKRIEQEQKWEKRPGPLCNWCDFYDTCMGGWI